MNDKTQINPTDATRCPIALAVRRIQDLSPAQLAFLALNGSYGEKLVASMLLESIARGSEAQRTEVRAYPKGRWTV